VSRSQTLSAAVRSAKAIDDPASRPVASSTRQLRVLYCTWGYSDDGLGGAEKQAQLQAESLVKRGHKIEVVCPRWPGAKQGLLNGVAVRRLPFLNRRPLKTATYLASLFMFLLRNLRRYDLVHVHHAYFQADVAVLAGGLLRRPVWVKLAASGELGEIERMHRLAWLTRYVGLRRAARVQAISAAIATEAARVGVNVDRIIRIPNAVNIASYSRHTVERVREIRRRLDLPIDGVCVLFVGRLARHKGIPELLRVWCRLPPTAACLVLVGSLATMDPIEPVEFGLRDNILIRGWTADVVDYYAAADVFVLPSHVEGMSNALLEAMASSLAVISTDVGASRELLIHGQSGMLIGVGQEAQLEAALRLLIGSSDLRARLGAAARTSVGCYSVDVVIDMLEVAYQHMLEQQ
jgi:glycosyltransferase involved in cell wall biosynthesis